MIENIFNADTLYALYLIIGYFVVSLIIKILKFICKRTNTALDDKIVNKIEKWHRVNKERIKK